VSTARSMKPAKATRKLEIPAQVASGFPNIAPENQSILENALHAAQENLTIELKKDARDCEHSTAAAILAAQPAERLSAFYSGFDEWGDKLCASTTKYYNDCFDIARADRLPHDYLLSLARISSTDKLRSPAGFAKGLTEVEISAFLRITGLDRKEPAREVDFNGRVRWFVRHVCGDWSDLYPVAPAGQNKPFLLPLWFQHEWNIKASMAKLAWRPPDSAPLTPAIDESSSLNAEETEKFVLAMEELLIGKVRGAIAAADRKALIILGKSVTATIAPQPVPGSERTQTEKPQLRRFSSKLRRAVAYFISTNQNPSDQEIFAYLRENHRELIPPSWEQYPKLAADTFTKVRRVLSGEGQKRVNRRSPATSEKVPVR
jgi:hypothetical protein